MKNDQEPARIVRKADNFAEVRLSSVETYRVSWGLPGEPVHLEQVGFHRSTVTPPFMRELARVLHLVAGEVDTSFKVPNTVTELHERLAAEEQKAKALNELLQEEKRRAYHWRGSPTDLATDLRALLTEQETQQLIDALAEKLKPEEPHLPSPAPKRRGTPMPKPDDGSGLGF